MFYALSEVFRLALSFFVLYNTKNRSLNKSVCQDSPLNCRFCPAENHKMLLTFILSRTIKLNRVALWKIY